LRASRLDDPPDAGDAAAFGADADAPGGAGEGSEFVAGEAEGPEPLPPGAAAFPPEAAAAEEGRVPGEPSA
jgi:hypothetical protein